MYDDTETGFVFVDEVLKRTAKAILCDFDGNEEWIPLSQTCNSDDFEEGASGELEIAMWLIRDRGLEEV